MPVRKFCVCGLYNPVGLSELSMEGSQGLPPVITLDPWVQSVPTLDPSGLLVVVSIQEEGVKLVASRRWVLPFPKVSTCASGYNCHLVWLVSVDGNGVRGVTVQQSEAHAPLDGHVTLSDLFSHVHQYTSRTSTVGQVSDPS